MSLTATFIRNRMFAGDFELRIFLYILVLIGALVPILNIFTSPDSSFHLSDYHISLFGKYLTYGLLALSLDLVWGILWYFKFRSRSFFCFGWLLYGYAFNARNWTKGCIW